MAGATRPGDRPVSPFLQVWRWHITMLASILHRVTGIGNYGAAILFAGWLVLVASGPEAYAPAHEVLVSPIGQFLLYLYVANLSFHFANGIRHFVFDAGRGLKPADAEASGWGAILFAIAAPIGLWALVTFGG